MKISSTSEKHLEILDTLVARARAIAQILLKKNAAYAFQENATESLYVNTRLQ